MWIGPFRGPYHSDNPLGQITYAVPKQYDDCYLSLVFTWVQRNLSDLATFSKGKGYSKSDLLSDGFPAILYGRMYTNYESQINAVSDTFVADATDAVLSQTGDVIVPGSGETPEDIARASNVNVSGVVLGGDINIIRPDGEKMDSTFLALTISNGQQQTELIKRAQGKSVVHLHNSDLKKVNVMAPSKAEQRAISSLFNQLDNLIAANQRKVDALKTQKSAYLERIFNQKLRFDGFTEPWVQRKVSETAEVNPKTALPDEFEYVDLGAVVGTTLNETRHEYKESAPSRAQRLASAGDVFYQTVRPYQKNNYLFENADSTPFVFSTGYAQLRPQGDSYFLLTLLQVENFVSRVMDRSTGTSYPAINSSDLGNMHVDVPEDAEQTKIGSLFKSLDKLIAANQKKVDILTKQKSAYLQKIFI